MDDKLLIYNYIERLSNLLRSEERRVGSLHGLQPVQLEALHYLSLCNRYSDTPKGVTEYLGQTKGTVSQSLKLLEQKGYITKHKDLEDKRLMHLKVTRKGQKVLSDAIVPELFLNAFDTLKSAEVGDISTQLKKLLSSLQQANHMKTFAVCATCIHHLTDEKGQNFCDLTKESLSVEDAQKLCIEHEVSLT